MIGNTKAEKSGRFSFTHLVYRFSAFFVLGKPSAPVLYTYAHYVLYLLREAIQQLFDQITSQVTGYDLLDKQLMLTRRKKERLLFFLEHPNLPIHNNQCEQDIRSFVIIRKISGGTKSYRGDKSLARHLSIIQIAQKQGLKVYQTLHASLTAQRCPAALTANICEM